MKWSSGSCRPAVGRRVQTSAVGCARQSGAVGCARQSGAAARRVGAAWRVGAEAWRVGAAAWRVGAAWRGGAEAWRGGGGGGALWSGRDFGCSPYSVRRHGSFPQQGQGVHVVFPLTREQTVALHCPGRSRTGKQQASVYEQGLHEV